MKRTETNLDARVYKYGAVCTSNSEKNQPRYLIDALWQMNNIWNQLVELGEKQRIIYDDARRDASLEYRELAKALEWQEEQITNAYKERRSARAAASSRDPEHPKIKPVVLKINQLKAERKELWETIRPIRAEAGKLIDPSLRKGLNTDFNEACKEPPKVENCDYTHSISAQAIAKNFKDMRDTALKNNVKLRFHRFKGEGRFVYPLRKKGMSADGISFEDLLNPDILKNKDFIVLDQHNKGTGTGKKSRIPVIRVKVRIKGAPKREDYKFLEFDVILHRPIPKGGILSRVELVRNRQGDRFFWHACFTVRLPHPEPRKPKQSGVIALDLGWRGQETISNQPTLKMAVIAKGHGAKFEIEEYCLPVGTDEKSNFVKSSEYIQELQGQLDNSATELGESIKPHLEEMKLTDSHQQYRFWRGMTNAPAHVTLSFEQAYKLAGWIGREQQIFSEALRVPVENWYSKWRNRYRELHNLRKRILANRDEENRKLAARLVKEGLSIILEDPRAFNLRKLAEKKDADNKLPNRALANRFLGAPGKLRAAIENAAKREGIEIIYVNPRNTSKTCSACRAVNPHLEGEEKWVCPSCGVEHDRDHNAAINIARRGMAGPSDKGRKRTLPSGLGSFRDTGPLHLAIANLLSQSVMGNFAALLFCWLYKSGQIASNGAGFVARFRRRTASRFCFANQLMSFAMLRGLIAPILTPFDDNLDIDQPLYNQLAHRLLKTGCAGLAPFGTTGEALSISGAERMKALEGLIADGVDPAVMIPGTGLNNLPDTAALSRHALELGCGGVMVLPPFYYKGMADQGLYDYFARLIERIDHPDLKIYLYHIPQVAGVGLSLDLVRRLRGDFPDQIVGIKDSSGDWANTEALLGINGLIVYPGAELPVIEAIRLGAPGCISATANLNAGDIAEVIRLCHAGEWDAAETKHKFVKEVRLLFQDYAPIPAQKALLARMTGQANWNNLRPPFLALAEDRIAQLSSKLATDYGFAI